MALTRVALTGIAAPWIASFMARRQAELQTSRAREDELRLVLENAGVKLTEAITVVGRVGPNLSTIGQPQVIAVQAEIDQLWKNDDRVRVRPGGNSPEAQHYRRAIETGIIPANSVFLQAGSGVKDPGAP